MLIVIPSMGRPASLITLRNLTSVNMRVTNPIVVCVPESQVRRYEGYMREPAKLVGVPDVLKGIAPTREWILTELPKQYPESGGRVFMLDDDMDFCYRKDVKDPKLDTIVDSERLQSLVDRFDEYLQQGFVHVGLSARQGNNRPFIGDNGKYELHAYRDATRMMNAYAYDTKVIQRLVKQGKVVLGRMEVMEDFDLTLQLLRLGYANRVVFEYCWNQRGSGKDGGCSSYRTPTMQARAAEMLHSFHPDFVEVKVKKNKESSQSWKGMKERVDVQVRWRDAYASSGEDVKVLTGGKKEKTS